MTQTKKEKIDAFLQRMSKYERKKETKNMTFIIFHE